MHERLKIKGNSLARVLHVLLIAPFVGTLWVPFYNRVEPSLGGVPFFYWYQFMWIPIGAIITGLAYLATRERRS